MYKELYTLKTVGQDSVVSIAIRYGLDGMGIKSWWDVRFSAPVQTSPASYTMSTRSFLGVKWLRHGADHPSHLGLRLEKEYSYTLTPPLGLHGFFYCELYFIY